MRMNNSLADIETAFAEETAAERHRRQQLRREAAQRARSRRQSQVERGTRFRFAALVLTILATTVAVTWIMFQALAFIMGG